MRRSIILFFLIPTLAFAHPNGGLQISPQENQSSYIQWFTGPLLTPNAQTVPPRHPALEIALIATKNYGYYDSNWKLKYTSSILSLAPYFDFQASFSKSVGFELIGSVATNFSRGESFTHLQDTILRLGLQVSNDKADSLVPDFRIVAQEIFPTGKYQKLNPKKNGTDSTGEGSFQTGVHAVFQKLFNRQGKHPIRIRADVGYFIPAAVSVKGLNCYGGTPQTDGKAYPGNYFVGFLFGELALTDRSAVALELNYQHGWRGKFSGQQNTKMNFASFEKFWALPEFQYTLTEKIGLIFGGWFTLAGKNTTAFRGGFASVLFLF